MKKAKGVDEHAVVDAITGDKAPALKVGDVLVRVDPRYFRPAEVETLLGDPTKARPKLGWVPRITVQTPIRPSLFMKTCRVARMRGSAVDGPSGVD